MSPQPPPTLDDSVPDQAEPPKSDGRPRKLNVPNVFSAVRVAGSFVLLGLALGGYPTGFFWLFILLEFTDWIDGKLAKLLDQETTFGARLDSVADAAMYGAMVLGTCRLKWDLVNAEVAWIVAVGISYGLTTGLGLLRFRRVPSYHTRSAKTCWLFVLLALVFVFLIPDWSRWPLRIAAAAVIAANLEATLITLVLREWQANVPSVLHAVRARSSDSQTVDRLEV
jgi:CDP-diacylglycerol--glycerol-3-phosphate 3-phosphatidyltransferase